MRRTIVQAVDASGAPAIVLSGCGRTLTITLTDYAAVDLTAKTIAVVTSPELDPSTPVATVLSAAGGADGVVTVTIDDDDATALAPTKPLAVTQYLLEVRVTEDNYIAPDLVRVGFALSQTDQAA